MKTFTTSKLISRFSRGALAFALLGAFVLIPACALPAEGPLCDCGAVQGSDQCCSAEAEHCEACGKIAGSPGCCSSM